MKLFVDNLGTASNEQELNAIVKKHSALDPTYVAVATSVRAEQFRKLLEALWEKYEPYADKDFRQKFRHEFLQRCWEMFVTTVCLERGLSVVRKSSTQGPDIHIQHEGKDIWIEAVVATSGQGPDAVPEMLFGVAQRVPEEEMLLRLRQSLDAKFSQYKKYIQRGIVKRGDPFVIAVSRGSIDHVETDPPLITKCLFEIGHPVLSIPMNGGPRELSLSHRPTIKKLSGETVPMDFFVNPVHADVSAVIYCKNNILNHPEPHGSDFVIVHNPHAANPLPTNFLGVGEEWVPDGDKLRKCNRNA